jgi:FtsP/CotA-like multicopper oxidase with cupredoxin domain
MRFYSLPDKTAAPRVTRNFNFERGNGQWMINGRLMDADCATVRLRVKQNTVENWVLQNNSGGWMHPIHIHVEEFQILSRNGAAPPPFEISRKDVAPLHHGEQVRLFFRFRDWEGRYPLHCHNVVHEDHMMMLRWDIDQTGDTTSNP